MPFLLRHILRHKTHLQAIREAGCTALSKRFDKNPAPPRLPGPMIHSSIPPLAPSLIRDYLREVGANEFDYDKVLPAHLFPYWILPAALKSIAAAPYPIHKTLNGGCEIRLNQLIPADEPIVFSCQLEEIRETDRHITFVNRAHSGTASSPDALETVFYGILPKSDVDSPPNPEQPKKVIPEGIELLETISIPQGAGLRFSLLTGDFNPIHWLSPYAKIAGFSNTILQGFGTLAWVMEALNKTVTQGAPTRVEHLAVRFTRPLVLPAEIRLYHAPNGRIFVGNDIGERPYLVGNLTLRDKR